MSTLSPVLSAASDSVPGPAVRKTKRSSPLPGSHRQMLMGLGRSLDGSLGYNPANCPGFTSCGMSHSGYWSFML